MKWELVPADPPLGWDDLLPEEPKAKRYPPTQCLCGRFAKFVRGQSYYNGTWDCYRTIVNCSRCGEVWIEHV